MHIPDGFLTMPTVIATSALSAVAIGVAVYRTNKTFKDKMVPMMGIIAAFIFAAQMINFPVAGGTSGHLLGGVLAAVLLGPWAGVLILTSVLIVQMLIFQDGGLLALGTNVFNMAVVGVLLGFVVFKILRDLIKGDRGLFIATFIASWLSVVVASAFAAIELAVSGTSPLGVALPAMLGIHAIIGIGEAIITTGVVAFVYGTRRDLVKEAGAKPLGRGAIVVGLVISLVVAGVVSYFASPDPDGLEKVAEVQGFIDKAVEEPALTSPVPDYEMPGVASPFLATSLAGILGTIIVFPLGYGIAKLITVRKGKERNETCISR